MREKIANFLQHLSWALGGQQCDCGSNPFNSLARWMDQRVNADDQWSENFEPIGRWSRAIDKPSTWLSKLGMWIDPS